MMHKAARCLSATLLLLAALPALLSCSSIPVSTPIPAGLNLHETVLHLAKVHNVCHADYATIKRGSIQEVNSASGCDAQDPLRRAPATTIFQAASLSKPVVAYAALKLVQAGRMALDVPLIGYLPKGYAHRHQVFQKSQPGVVDSTQLPELSKVTMRMVLTHTSGLPNWAQGPLRFDSAPGGEWRYSGEGFMLLQQAMEALGGQDLETLMQQFVFMPLGMKDSSFRFPSTSQDRVVPGRRCNGQARRHFEMTEPVAAASLHTTAGDYARFVAALLNDETLMRQVDAQPRVIVDARRNLGWTLGWGLEGGHDGGATYLWHWGNNPGFRSFVMASNQGGDAFVLLTDSDCGMALAEPIANTVLPGRHATFQFHMLY